MGLFRGLGARKDATRGTSPIEVRKALAGLFASTGVLPGGASPLLTGDATWAYNVGIANFVTSLGASDGDQLYGNDGVALIGATGVGSTVPIAPGAGLSRIDIAWTRHPTNGENGDTSSDPLFGVASGTAASSSPVAPTIPPGALELGRNLMTSAATSTASAGNTITQSAPVASLQIPPPVVVNAELTANSAGFYLANTGLLSAPSITGDGVKKFKITVNFQAITSTGASDVFNINIDDSTLSNILTNRQFVMPATAGSQIGACMTTVDVPAVGAHVYRLTGTRTAGSGIGTLPANANSPIEIIVEQIT